MRDMALNILNDWKFKESSSKRLSEYKQIVSGTIDPNLKNGTHFFLVMAEAHGKILLHIKGLREPWEQYSGKVNEPDIVARLICRAIADLHYRKS